MKVGERLSVWDTLVDGEVADHAWKYNLARIIFDGLIGEVPADARRAQGKFTVRLKRKSEQVQFRFPMQKDPVQGWEPVDGRKAVHDAAMRALMLQQEPLAEDGKAFQDRLREARYRKDPDHNVRLHKAQQTADAIRARAPGAYFTRKGLLRKIAEKTGIPFSTLRDWKDLRLKLEPDE